jgi:hypothetical protein
MACFIKNSLLKSNLIFIGSKHENQQLVTRFEIKV